MLLTEELYKQLKDQSVKAEHTESPEFQQIRRVDQRLKEILEDTTFTPQEKASKYAQALQDLQELRERAPETKQAQKKPVQEVRYLPAETTRKAIQTQTEDMEAQPIEEEGEEVLPAAIAGEVRKDIYDLIPEEQKREDARDIIEKIEEHSSQITFDPNSLELIVEGEVIPDSDIAKLLYYVTRDYPIVKREPLGLDSFMKKLGEIGVDKTLIPSTNLKYKMKPVSAKLRSQVGKGVTVLKWDFLPE